MHNLYHSIRVALISIFCLGLSLNSSAALRQPATSVVSARNVANKQQAVDNSPTTAATLSASPLLGGASLRLGFDSTVPEGGVAGLVIQAGSNLDLSLLSNMSIRTYMGSGSGYLEEFPLNSLISLSTLSAGGPATVEFTAHNPFNQVELRIGGLLNASFDVDVFSAYGTLAAPLPVELMAFQGKSTVAGTALTWSTASERNSDYFVVERADGTPENFQPIGKVQSAGTTTRRTDYSFTDTRPAALSYYRLRQVDRDGTTNFSSVVTIKRAAWSQLLAVYPNPAAEAVNIAGTPGTRFAVLDQLGRQLQAGEIPAGAQPALDVRALPNGVYFVRDLATGHSTRFVKTAAAQ